MLNRTIAFILLAAVLSIRCYRREEQRVPVAPAGTPVAPAAMADPLPTSAILVKWSAPTVPEQLAPGSTTIVSVTFANAGDKPWPDKGAGNPAKRDGAHAVRLGYAWRRGEQPVERRPERADLPHPLQPAESVTLDISVVAPAAPGDYVLEFDLVQELLFWFSDQGADSLKIPVKVQPL